LAHPAFDDSMLLRRALESLPMGVVLADADGRPVVDNGLSQRVDGHGRVLLNAVLERVLAKAVSGQVADEQLELFGPPKRVLAVHASPLAEGGALATVEDISERVRLDAIRTDFVANISHEMKTPVGAMAVLAEAIADSDDPDTMRRLADKMVNEAHRVSGAIDELLELSRIELGGIDERDIVSIDTVVREAMQRCATRAANHEIQLQFHHDELHHPAAGDARQLISAVANLIDNAIKYSDDGSRVQISAWSDSQWVEVRVADEGIGIPARDLDRIFERFYRVDRARSRGTGGVGLGLAIVRHVATNHGGEVTVVSQEGEGSTFTIRVPAYQQER
jgi:two-component system sensor histidine kinase SenX3